MKFKLAHLKDKRLWIMLILGFSSGIPLALTGPTLQAWLTDSKLDITTIGLFSLVGLPYAWKFVWSPLFDRYSLSFLGRRRGWLLVTQIILAIFIAVFAFTDPMSAPHIVAIVAFIVAFLSATQDILVDALRTESLEREQAGIGSGIFVMGYRVAMIVSGAMALALSEHMTWSQVYLLLSLTMIVGVLGTLLIPEPKNVGAPKSLKEAFTVPFIDFFKRPGCIEILIFILLYKLDSVVTSALMTKFFLDVGYTKTEIAFTVKVFGMIATIFGGIVGGLCIPWLGLRPALIWIGILQGASNLLYGWVALVGNKPAALIATIGGDNFISGMGNSVAVAFLMLLCNRKFTAAQYALLSSIVAITRTMGGAFTGYLASWCGVTESVQNWWWYYLIATFLAVPGLLMLTRYKKWHVETAHT